MNTLYFIVADVVICLVANIHCQSKGPIVLFQALLSELLVPSSCLAFTVTTSGGRHGEFMKLWKKNCLCAHHLKQWNLRTPQIRETSGAKDKEFWSSSIHYYSVTLCSSIGRMLYYHES